MRFYGTICFLTNEHLHVGKLVYQYNRSESTESKFFSTTEDTQLYFYGTNLQKTYLQINWRERNDTTNIHKRIRFIYLSLFSKIFDT